MADAELTVLLATRNGASVLPRTLDGYCRATAPATGWKLVIVDNGSTDETPQIIESFKKQLPITSPRQPAAGKNRALNTGIAWIEGRLVVLTDDDAIPHESFLTAWAKLLENDHDCGLFGGSIEPLFDTSPPQWLLDSRFLFAQMFGERNLAEGPIGADAIYGGNMAVASAVFMHGFRFDEDLGPNGLDPNYPMGSETEFCRRVASTGVKCWFASEPRVSHIVWPAQFTAAAWAKRAYRCGRGRAYQMWKRGEIHGAPTPSLMDLAAAISPLARHRLGALGRRELTRGFRDECARRIGSGS
jgi:glycosyltransferase involved in cell wall biosynthesis